MAKITNSTDRPIRLLTGHVVPAKDCLETTNEVIRSTDNLPMLGGLAKSGQVSLEFDAERDADGIATPTIEIKALPEAQAQADADRQLAIASEESAAAQNDLADRLAGEPAPKKK